MPKIAPALTTPTVRWKAEDLEQAIVDDLAKIRMPTPEMAAWFRTALQSAVINLTTTQRRQATTLAKRKSELAAMQHRLLNAYLAGTLDEATYVAKSNELKGEAAKTDEALAKTGGTGAERGETAVALFDWAQKAADLWRGSNNSIRREILDSVCLNRELGHLTLVTTKRKPFDVFAEGLDFTNSRGDCQSVEPRERLVDPYVAAVIETPDVCLDTVAELARECA